MVARCRLVAARVSAALPFCVEVCPLPHRNAAPCAAGPMCRQKRCNRAAVHVSHDGLASRNTVLQVEAGSAPVVACYRPQVLSHEQDGVQSASLQPPCQAGLQCIHALQLLFDARVRVVAHLLDVARHFGSVVAAKRPQVAEQVVRAHKEAFANMHVEPLLCRRTGSSRTGSSRTGSSRTGSSRGPVPSGGTPAPAASAASTPRTLRNDPPGRSRPTRTGPSGKERAGTRVDACTVAAPTLAVCVVPAAVPASAFVVVVIVIAADASVVSVASASSVCCTAVCGWVHP